MVDIILSFIKRSLHLLTRGSHDAVSLTWSRRFIEQLHILACIHVNQC